MIKPYFLVVVILFPSFSLNLEACNKGEKDYYLPLIHFVQLQLNQIDKVALTIDFQMESVNKKNEATCVKSQTEIFRKQKNIQCKLELQLKHQFITDGLRVLADSYDAKEKNGKFITLKIFTFCSLIYESSTYTRT